MKIVISGSEGFIGKRLKRVFQENYDFEIEYLDIVNGHDLCRFETIQNIGPCDVFIHLAALSYVPDSFKNPRKFYHVNICSTLNALEFCRLQNARMLFISSYVYGKPEYLPIDEKHPLNAFNPYAQTKIICEKLCEGYNRDFGLTCTVLRPFNIYGEGQNKSFLLPSIISQIKSGGKTIKLMDPSPRRDFIHVDDVVKAIELFTKNLTDVENHLQFYNIASGKSHSVLELTEIIKTFGDPFNKIKFEFTPQEVRKNEVNETVGSYQKIKKEIGWEPSVSIEDGLKRLLLL